MATGPFVIQAVGGAVRPRFRIPDFFYGGQALIEGVMMRGRTTAAMSVRMPAGEIRTLSEPLPGVLAITMHTLGAQGKLFAEVNENASMLPIEGIRSAGGNWFQEIRYGVLPQVLPNFMSYTFWRVELNVRSATIVGFVGAGGIGHDLFTSIQLLYFADAGAILLIVIATIMLIDMISEKYRHLVIGKDALGR